MRAATRTRDLRGEEGSVLLSAVVLLSIMLTIGLASFAIADNGQQRAREQRERETSLNLAEAVLSSQGFILAQTWPGSSAAQATMPDKCTQLTAGTQCPDPNTIAAANSSAPAAAIFTSVDASADVTWETRIRDNSGQLADAFDYASADASQTATNAQSAMTYTCPTGCRWDANGDLKLWVQARAIVRGRPRNLVALLAREQFAEAFARNTVTAGGFETSNNGNKTIIDASGSQVVVRCTTPSAPCTDYEPGKGQILPATVVRDAATPPAMSSAQVARFKSAAQSANPSTYYTSCPASLAGAVVFIDLPAGAAGCSNANNATYNSAAAPGIVIMPRGTLEMKSTFYGLVYMANDQASSGTVLTLGANAELHGGIAIDVLGRLDAGQASGSRPTITFMPNAFDSLATYGTTGLVQNTWRELGAG